MVATSRELKVRYVGDDSALRKTIAGISQANQSLSSKLQNVGKSMFRTGRTITTGITLPLVAMGKVAVDEFTELQHVNAQTAAALKSTGSAANVTVDQVHRLASELGNLTAQDGEAVQATENLLLTFTNIRNEVGKGNDIFNRTSLAVQDMSAAMGQDAKSSAIQLGKALNDPITGLTSLRRIGVAFTAQQQKQIARLVENNDLLGAQKIILGEVNREFGGSAKALGDTASPATRLNLAFRDMAESLGKVLSPILDKVTGWLQKVFTWFENLSPSTKRWIVYAGLLAAALGPVLLILGALVTAIGVLISPITLVVAGIAALVFAFFKWRRVTMIVLTALFPIIGVVRLIVEHFQGLKKVTLAVWGWIERYIGPIVKAMVSVVVAQIRLLWSVIRGVWDVLKSATRAAWAAIKAFVITPVRVIKDAVVGAFRFVRDAVAAAWDSIADKVAAVVDFIAGKIEWLVGKLTWLSDHLPKGGSLGGFLTGGFLRGAVTPPGGSLNTARGSLEPLAAFAGGGSGGAQVNVVVNVAGSVLSERDLAEVVRREFVKVRRRNGGRLGLE